LYYLFIGYHTFRPYVRTFHLYLYRQPKASTVRVNSGLFPANYAAHCSVMQMMAQNFLLFAGRFVCSGPVPVSVHAPLHCRAATLWRRLSLCRRLWRTSLLYVRTTVFHRIRQKSATFLFRSTDLFSEFISVDVGWPGLSEKMLWIWCIDLHLSICYDPQQIEVMEFGL